LEEPPAAPPPERSCRTDQSFLRDVDRFRRIHHGVCGLLNRSPANSHCPWRTVDHRMTRAEVVQQASCSDWNSAAHPRATLILLVLGVDLRAPVAPSLFVHHRATFFSDSCSFRNSPAWSPVPCVGRHSDFQIVAASGFLGADDADCTCKRRFLLSHGGNAGHHCEGGQLEMAIRS